MIMKQSYAQAPLDADTHKKLLDADTHKKLLFALDLVVVVKIRKQ